MLAVYPKPLTGSRMTETTVFQSGNSQGVRLPKEFRFGSKTVEIFRRGNEVVLREKPRTVGDLLDEAFADLPPLTAEDHAAMDIVLATIKAPPRQQERDWKVLFGPAARTQKANPSMAKPSKATPTKAASTRR